MVMFPRIPRENAVEKIYVVSSDERIRASLKDILGSHWRVESFVSIAEFSSRKSNLTNFAVLLLDARNCADCAWVSVCDNKLMSGFRTIVIANRGDVDAAVRAIKAGASDVAEHPFCPIPLREMIVRVAGSLAIAVEEERQTIELCLRATRLSPRERQVLQSLSLGRASKQVAWELSLSKRTIDMYRAKILHKLGAHNTREALHVARSAGLI